MDRLYPAAQGDIKEDPAAGSFFFVDLQTDYECFSDIYEIFFLRWFFTKTVKESKIRIKQ